MLALSVKYKVNQRQPFVIALHTHIGKKKAGLCCWVYIEISDPLLEMVTAVPECLEMIRLESLFNKLSIDLMSMGAGSCLVAKYFQGEP